MGKPILLYTAIRDSSAEAITNQILEAAEGEAIEIWLNSPGGSLTATWSILVALQENKAVNNMTVVGDASSGAFFMLLFADNVIAYDTSNFLIHRAATLWEGEMSEDELKDLKSRNNTIRKKLEARIDEDKFIKVTGKTFDDIFSLDDRLDVVLTARQAKKVGLVDKVIKLNVREREKIEAQYFDSITALAEPIKENSLNNSQLKKGNMSKLSDLIFGEKDPVLLATVGETQVVYSKIEVNAKVKAIGDVKEAVSGTFEVNDSVITVVENEITAIVEIDNKQKEIDAFKAEIIALKESQVSIADITEVIEKLQANSAAEITAIKATLDKAKLTVSAQKLPEGEFKEDAPVDNRSKTYRIQQDIEAKAKERQESRNK